MFRFAALMSLAIVPAHQPIAADCRLDHATYRENVSGAELVFRTRDTSKDDTLAVGQFQLRLPNMAEVFPGDITWNSGNNARPDGEIGRTCTSEEKEDAGACWLWTGNAYSLDNASAGLVDDADMKAPKAILLADFGRSLAVSEAFMAANPDRRTFDVFTLKACRP